MGAPAFMRGRSASALREAVSTRSCALALAMLGAVLSGLYKLRKNPMFYQGTTFRSGVNAKCKSGAASAAEGTTLAPSRIFSAALLSPDLSRRATGGWASSSTVARQTRSPLCNVARSWLRFLLFLRLTRLGVIGSISLTRGIVTRRINRLDGKFHRRIRHARQDTL